MKTKKDHSLNETIEGFRVPKAISKKLHDFLESEGITKKKWLESKLNDDLDYKAILNVNKTNSVLIPKNTMQDSLPNLRTHKIPLTRFLIIQHLYLMKMHLGKII